MNSTRPLCTVHGLRKPCVPFCNSKPRTVMSLLFQIPVNECFQVHYYSTDPLLFHNFHFPPFLKKTPRALSRCPASLPNIPCILDARRLHKLDTVAWSDCKIAKQLKFLCIPKKIGTTGELQKLFQFQNRRFSGAKTFTKGSLYILNMLYFY
jgi:hypothetical protein